MRHDAAGFETMGGLQVTHPPLSIHFCTDMTVGFGAAMFFIVKNKFKLLR